MSGLDLFSGSELQNVSEQMKGNAEDYVNDQNIEMQWAVKAYHHAETYFSLVCAVSDTKKLRLTRLDDEIYTHFRSCFGDDYDIKLLNEDEMKSKEGKVKWREFCEIYKEKMDEYNTGSLLRIDADEGLSEKNTMFATRIQFLAIEIARNREGYNEGLRAKFKGGPSDS